jgi:hypothetical protein
MSLAQDQESCLLRSAAAAPATDTLPPKRRDIAFMQFDNVVTEFRKLRAHILKHI